MKRLVFLVGASGAGKTTVARLLGGRTPWLGRVSSRDDLRIPTPPAILTSGSEEERQRWTTNQFVSAALAKNEPLQLLDIQTRPSFINAALDAVPSAEAIIILLDCTVEARRRRLVELRQSPELASPKMDSWAAYLCGQAHALSLPIIDTSELSVAEVAGQVESLALEGLALGSL